nr:ParM/StbA family protein [Bacilli bacterium]
MIIGLDAGYGHTKWTTDGVTVKTIPSVVSPTNLQDFDSDMFGGGGGYRDLALEIAGARYLVGEFALREDAQATRVISAERTSGVEFKALVSTVLLSEMLDKDTVVCTGLPYNAPKEALAALESELKNLRLSANGISGVIKDKFWSGTLKDVHVYRQAQAVIFDAVFAYQGKKIVPVRDQELLEVAGTRVAVVDIGYKTTDVIVCELNPEFRVIKELSFTVSHAVSSVGKHLQEDYKRITRNGESALDARRLDQVIIGGKIPDAGKVLDMSVERDQATKVVGRQIMNQVFEKWGQALSTIQVVYLGGGGGELFGDYLTRNLHPNVYKIKDAQGANARGYFKMQQFM